MPSKWSPVGGLAQNLGTWDDGNGAHIYVESRPDGVIRRRRVSYSGRGGNWTVYTFDGNDLGGAFVPAGVKTYKTAAQAVRAAWHWPPSKA